MTQAQHCNLFSLLILDNKHLSFERNIMRFHLVFLTLIHLACLYVYIPVAWMITHPPLAVANPYSAQVFLYKPWK